MSYILLVEVLVFIFQIGEIKEKNAKEIETAATPGTEKIVVIDAGHRPEKMGEQ